MIGLAELKLAIRHALDPDDDTEDAYLEQLEAAAVEAAQRWTGRDFGDASERTEYLPGAGTGELWLAEEPTGPVVVTEAAYAGGGATAVEDFVLRGRRLVRTSGGVWWIGCEYAATYTAGYAAGEEPADIRLAVCQLVGHWYENREPVMAGASVAEIPLTVRDLLAPWRRLV